MPLAVILGLDVVSGKTVERLWDAAEGLPGAETTGMLGVPPHLTLAVYGDGAAAGLAEVCGEVAGELGPVGVDLAGLIHFPAEGGTLCLAPVPTTDLLRCHARFHQAAAAFDEDCHRHYRTGAWVPHITLVRNLPGRSVGRVIERLEADWSPVSGTLERLLLVSFMPVVEVASFALSGAPSGG